MKRPGVRPSEASRKIAKTDWKFPRARYRTRAKRDEFEGSWKISQRKSRSSDARGAAQLKRSRVWPPKSSSTVSRTSRTESPIAIRAIEPLAHKHRQPEHAADEQDGDAGAGKFEHDRRHHNAERRQPKDPAFSAMADFIVPAGDDHNGGEPEEIGCLVAIRKRTETALVMPERAERLARNKARSQSAASSDNPEGENTQLAAQRAHFHFRAAT